MISLLGLHRVHDNLNINVLLDDLLQLPVQALVPLLLPCLPPLQGGEPDLLGGVPLQEAAVEGGGEPVLQGPQLEGEVTL